jgi:diguanylate cyclase (GGDEF)-like protein
VLEARDGQRGLELVHQGGIDLVLLDVTMPGLDGITVARRLKQDASTRHIPVILLTACRDADTKVEAFKAGADDYVTKPFQIEEVDARIQASLQRHGLLVSLQSQVKDLSTNNEHLEQLLQLDEKTGLYNFREFQRRLKDEWQRAKRYNMPLSVVFFDLDHFKQINDTLGHQAGDGVLKEFATLVAGGARANDVAARYGGEEFAVVLPHTDGPMAVRVAERIRRAVEQFIFLAHESPTRITVSAGVATATESTPTVEALIRAADQALYAAKDAGRNRVVEAGAG